MIGRLVQDQDAAPSVSQHLPVQHPPQGWDWGPGWVGSGSHGLPRNGPIRCRCRGGTNWQVDQSWLFLSCNNCSENTQDIAHYLKSPPGQRTEAQKRGNIQMYVILQLPNLGGFLPSVLAFLNSFLSFAYLFPCIVQGAWV